MKNVYESPKFEIVLLNNLDVITTSSEVIYDFDWNIDGWTKL